MRRDGSGCSYEDPGQGWTCGIRVGYDAGTTIKGRKRPRTVATEGCPIATDEHPAEEPDRDGAPGIIPRTLESSFVSYARCNLPHAGFFFAGLHGTEHIEMNEIRK